MKKLTSKFLFIADDPCLDFLNTQLVDKGNLVDRLENFTDLVNWLNESRLVKIPDATVKGWKNKREAEQSLARAKEFRGLLHEMVVNLIQRKGVPSSTIEEINRHMSRRNVHPLLARDGSSFIKV